MRCKRHTVDFSSSIGVCASCLRERLLSLAASNAASENDDTDNHRHSRISPPPPPPLVLPRSVSPYVAPRKSDAGGGDSFASNSRFFATPQVRHTTDQSYGGGSSSSEKVLESDRSFKKKRNGLSRFSSLFRTRSDDFDTRSKFSSRDSCDLSTFSPSSSSSSRSWLSKVLSIRSKKQSTITSCYIEDLIASESDHHQNRARQRFCRGMSPAGDATVTDFEGEPVEEIPRRTPAMGTPGSRKTATIGIGRSVSGMAFCLSPLVRAKPNCSAKWKGKCPPDFGYPGELNYPAKPHISTAASFCANRSKKLVDLGRVDQRR